MTDRSTLSLPSALETDDWITRFRRGAASVFLDYDGTLTPIVGRPELATLSAETRAILRRLVASVPVTIVSGRDIAVLEALVGLDGLGYVGSHGLDIAGPAASGLRKEVGREFVPELDAVEAELRRGVDRMSGAMVERKRFSLSTHVRLVAPEDLPQVESLVAAQAAAHPSLRREGGKMLFELRPDVPWDKGTAVMWLLDAMGLDVAGTIFVGDDLTDETVFRVIGARGTSVVVADVDRPTAAGYRLRDPGEVRGLLERLVETAAQATDQG